MFEKKYTATGTLTTSKPTVEPGAQDGQTHHRMVVSGEENTDQYFQLILIVNPKGPNPDNAPQPSWDYQELTNVKVTVTIDVGEAIQTHHAKVP